MNSSAIPPQTVALKKGGAELTVTWKNGECSTIGGGELRRYCACSECRARKVVGMHLINDSAQISDLAFIGGHALNATFGDGHDRGIYPWTYLYAIAQGRALEHLNE